MTQISEEIKNELMVVSQKTGMDFTELKTLKDQLEKKATLEEFKLFITTCMDYQLSPLKKEIWFYKDHKDNLVMFAGRDGFRKLAKESGNLKDINTCEVCKNDKIKMGRNEEGQYIEHEMALGDRGEIIGAYAVVRTLNGGKVVEWADLKTYEKPYGVWKTHPEEMIKKVAEVHALKKAFNISGLYLEEEMRIENDKIVNEEIAELEESGVTMVGADDFINRIKATNSDTDAAKILSSAKISWNAGVFDKDDFKRVVNACDDKIEQVTGERPQRDENFKKIRKNNTTK